MDPSPILKIMELAMRQSPRPFARLTRGKPIAEGRKAVAALSEQPSLLQGALYLCFDCFDEAHHVANENEGTVAGNWIHAIVHRREPDASNSKYWYHRVKVPEKRLRSIGKEALGFLETHPAKELESLAQKLGMSKSWEPEAFVDLCEKFRDGNPDSAAYRTLAGIQEIEWKGLADFILSDPPSSGHPGQG